LNSYSNTPDEVVNFVIEDWNEVVFERMAIISKSTTGSPVSLAVAFTLPLITR
jgi:hypothetical protein